MCDVLEYSTEQAASVSFNSRGTSQRYGWGHLVPEGETHNFNPGFSRQQKFNKLKERYSKLEEMD